MNRGRVRVTNKMLAEALFPGADVAVASVQQTEEDKASDSHTFVLYGDPFKPVPEGADVPVYSCEIWRRYQNGAYLTTVKFT
jgi:hypothetical protein